MSMDANSRSYRTILMAVVVPTIYAILLRLIFGVKYWDDLYSVMSISFLFLSPVVVGALTVFLSKREAVDRLAYCIFAPWVPIFLFLIITLAFAIEGWGCWLMVLPLFLISASIGGLIGRYIKKGKTRDRLSISIIALFPLFLSPLENMIGSIPGTYEAYTYIDINSTAEKIWDNVTRVQEIPKREDKGLLNRILGFPRPVKAVLNFEGVGAYREAIFTNGLVFHETVIEYQDNKKMVFSIKAYPYEIPSTTLDEHIVIGGDYFDVLNGTYELEKIGDETYRLHLYSRFKLNTTFNFYASWWARWIMEDIQNNILQVEKKRAESN